MTDLGLIEEEQARTEKTIRRAMEAFEITVEALNEAVSRLREEYRAGEKAVMTDLKAMNGAFQFAMQLEARARETAGKQHTGGGAGSLDLDAAREEIGLRLACLRAAGND